MQRTGKLENAYNYSSVPRLQQWVTSKILSPRSQAFDTWFVSDKLGPVIFCIGRLVEKLE
ncbi:hypothetical protein GCM10027428_34920 [Haliea atlantica]